MKFRAAVLTDPHPRPWSIVLSSFLLHSRRHASFWTGFSSRSFIQVQVFSFPALHHLLEFPHDFFGRSRSLSNVSTYSEEYCTAFALPQNFCVVQPPSFPHLFNETHYFVFLFFPFTEFVKPVTELVLVPFFLFFVCGRAFDHCLEVSISFRTLTATSVPRDVLFFHECIDRFIFFRTSFHLPFGFTCSQASWELGFPLLPAGCCHLVFVVPYHSLLFHLSLFSVIAFFRTAVAFLTLDSLFLLRDEHEDDRDNLCIVPELKDATASSITNHSSPLSSSSSSPEDEG